MFRLKAQRLARQHDLGRVLDVVPVRPSWVQALVVLSPVLLMLVVVPVNAALGNGVAWQALVAAAVVVAVLWPLSRADRLAICEGGVLMGNMAPFVRPFRIRWSEVDPATLVFVTPYVQVARALAPGTGGMAQVSSARRGPAHGRAALGFAGPRIATAALGRFMNEPINTVHGGHLWFAGVGDSRVDRTRRALLQAWAPLLGPDLARLERQLAAPIRLADDPVAAARQLPGFAR